MLGRPKEATVTDGSPMPNVLWICTDQQRYDTIHSLGNDAIRTPNLDRIAATGVAFRNTYVQSTICTPSRASFLTGCYPNRTRVHRNGNTEVLTTPPLVTKLLADAGYDCGLVGKFHLSRAWGQVENRPDDGYRVFEWSHKPGPESFWPTEDHAYQRWLRQKGIEWSQVYPTLSPEDLELERASELPQGWGDREVYPHLYRTGVPSEYHEVTWSVDTAIEFMMAPRDTPWLMSVNTFAPHPPLDPPREYLDRIDRSRVPLPIFAESDRENQALLSAQVDFQVEESLPPTEYDARGMVAAYYAEIELIDAQVGRLLDTLEATGQRQNTIVIFTSDHGEMLGDHGLMLKGCRFYEGLVRVPLLFSWPGHFLEGASSDALVELVDIVPTILQSVGVEIPAHVQGRSLYPLLTDVGIDAAAHRSLVRCEYFDSAALPNGTHASMGFDGRYKVVVYHGLGIGELYDLYMDPRELRNLWDEAASQGIKGRIIAALFDASMLAADPGAPRSGRY